MICVYVIAYSSKSIAVYATGHALFDLATFEQGFWNATKGTLFFYSLEGEMSRFGRHFSPIFVLMLPFYALYRDPSTLLVLQAMALGGASIPLFLFAQRRLANPLAALIVAALYLASPVVHDINMVNEFHEISFSVPLLFLAVYALETRRWRLYWLAVIGTLMVKEEIALTVVALGVYVFLFARQRHIGLVTAVAGLVWFVVVALVLMPALRGPYGPVPIPGYDYLGQGIPGIATGIFTKTGELIAVMTAQPKIDYLYWLFEPLLFLPLLAPEVLFVAFPALLEIFASTYPPTYEIFERYVAPVIPFVFVAAVIAVGRVRFVLGKAALSRSMQAFGVVLLCLFMGAGTIYAQSKLLKYPFQLLTPQEPDPHSAVAIQFTAVIPEEASVSVEDHRWLSRLAHREHLYFLSNSSPDTDYFLLDRKVPPITGISLADREAAIRRITRSSNYSRLRTEDGVSLYVRKEARNRDGELLTPYRWDHERLTDFSSTIRLLGYSLESEAAHAGEGIMVTFYWQALREPIDADYTVFVQVLNKANLVVAQHDGVPQNSWATTLDWKENEIVRDPHVLVVKRDTPPGEYQMHVGLYTLSDMKRLSAVGPDNADDSVSIPLGVE